MKKYRCLVFDWDGTLMDSTQKIVECLQAAASDVGLPVPATAAAKDIIGLGLRDSMLAIFGEVSESDIANMINRYRVHFFQENQTYQPLYPNVRSGLEQLDKMGVALCVATGKSRRGLDRVMQYENLASLFFYTRCADEARSKPNPQMLFDILNHLALESDEVLMIGDTSYDMEMAGGANMDAVGIEYGVHTRQRLLSSGAKDTFTNFKALLDWLIPRVEKVY